MAQRYCIGKTRCCPCSREPRLVLDSTICGMNGRCHLPERQRLPNLRHIYFFLSSCPPLQEEWQGASIDIKAAHKRMLIREDERGSLLFKFDDRLFAHRSAHFGAKTSAWHWGRVSGALLRLLHSFLYFRHAAWVYIYGWFLSPFPEVNFGNSIHFGHRFTSHYRDTSILEEIGIRQNDRL